MTKSNVGAVRRRKTNQRIARQFDKVEQDRVRAYQERSIDKRSTHIADGFNWAGFFRKTIKRIQHTFSRFFRRFRPKYSSMRGLDLRSGGLYGAKLKRDAGAQQLRSWFGQGLKMVSTRDGRKV